MVAPLSTLEPEAFFSVDGMGGIRKELSPDGPSKLIAALRINSLAPSPAISSHDARNPSALHFRNVSAVLALNSDSDRLSIDVILTLEKLSFFQFRAICVALAQTRNATTQE
jgi:hypothetical protein